MTTTEIATARPQPNAVGELIRALCSSQGRKFGWLAEQMEISRHRLARVMRGEVDMTLREADAAARALNVPLGTFLEEEPDGRVTTSERDSR